MGLSAVILLVRRRITLTECVDLLDSPLTKGAVSRILQLLQRQQQWHEIREALTKMATYLEEHGAPIDYGRRRYLDYTDLLPNSVWAQMCRDTGSPGAGRVRARAARCFLYERLSGMHADAAPFADSTTHFRKATANFAGGMTKDLAGALYEYAQDFLDGQNVHGEPATWQPQENLLQNMRLPGFDPTRGSTGALGHIAAGNMRIGEIANELRVSVDAARYLAEMNPADPPGWASGSAPRPPRLGAYRAAKMALPPERMRDLYNNRRMSLADIAAEVGVSRSVVARLAREYGLQVATPGPKVKHIFDRDWLFERYVNRKRSLTEIAAEAGVSLSTVARWAKTFGIPLRNRGGGSHIAVRTARALSSEAPELLRPALVAPGGWTRLQCFAATANYPTLTIAAQHLGVRQSVLTLKIRRIESELEMQLLKRAERGHPMTITAAGLQVIDAIAESKPVTEGKQVEP
ncbi:hypothetical protein MHEI_20030 [Mycobacterium heidelbergense]|nr:hypothetical protein MHEI_20030 [Mycobacterium heidelbergense]